MKYQLLEHVSLTEVDDEAVLLDLNTGSYYGLNHIGAHLMRVLEDNGSVNKAVEQITSKYHADKTTVEGDLRKLLDQLLEQNLIIQRDIE
jgi:hypothetical protein